MGFVVLIHIQLGLTWLSSDPNLVDYILLASLYTDIVALLFIG